MKQHGTKFFFLYIMPLIGIGIYFIGKLFVNPYLSEMLGIVLVIGFLGNVFSSYSSDVTEFDGDMLIDTSDPDRDIYRIVLDEPIEELANKETVSFKVHSNVILDDVEGGVDHARIYP